MNENGYKELLWDTWANFLSQSVLFDIKICAKLLENSNKVAEYSLAEFSNILAPAWALSPSNVTTINSTTKSTDN